MPMQVRHFAHSGAPAGTQCFANSTVGSEQLHPIGQSKSVHVRAQLPLRKQVLPVGQRRQVMSLLQLVGHRPQRPVYVFFTGWGLHRCLRLCFRARRRQARRRFGFVIFLSGRHPVVGDGLPWSGEPEPRERAGQKRRHDGAPGADCAGQGVESLAPHDVLLRQCQRRLHVTVASVGLRCMRKTTQFAEQCFGSVRDDRGTGASTG